MSKLIYSRNQRAIFLTLCANFHPSRILMSNSEQTNQLKIHTKLKCKSLDELLINTPRRYGMKSFQFFNIEFFYMCKKPFTATIRIQYSKIFSTPANLTKALTWCQCGIINQNNIICIFFAFASERIDPLRMWRLRSEKSSAGTTAKDKKHFPIYNNNTISWCSEQFFLYFLCFFPLLLRGGWKSLSLMAFLALLK